MEKIQFQTRDGVAIAGIFFPARESALHCAALLLHQMPRTKESWNALAGRLNSRGCHALAIDLRGHGESVLQKGRRLDYRKFSDAEQQAKRLDVDAALDWLAARGVPRARTALVGASIGANLALDGLVRVPDLPAAVLLSPGIDYRGVRTDGPAGRLGAGQSVFLAASEDDAYSFNTVNALDRSISAPHETVRLTHAGHGTDMFGPNPKLMDRIADWVTARVSAAGGTPGSSAR